MIHTTIKIYLEIPPKIGKKAGIHFYKKYPFWNRFAFTHLWKLFTCNIFHTVDISRHILIGYEHQEMFLLPLRYLMADKEKDLTYKSLG